MMPFSFARILTVFKDMVKIGYPKNFAGETP